MPFETWYVLEDGASADPADVATDKNGVLRHKDGRAVATRGNAYSSRGVDTDAERAKASKARDVKPEEPKRGYKTRESKAD
jgi:hypothetical protein